MAEATANEIQVRLLRLPILDEPLRPLAPVASQLARVHGLSVSDAFYLALAEAAGATFVTADGRLAGAATDAALLS